MKKVLISLFCFMFVFTFAGGGFLLMNSLGQPQQEQQIPDADNSGDDDNTTSNASGYWDSYYASSFAGGSGTSTSPYQIATAEQLARLAYLTNSASYYSTYVSKYYKLTADIDLSAHYWIPIGLKYNFTGNLNGDGHVINGMNCYSNGSVIPTYYISSLSTSTVQYVAMGLFGTVSGATIQNFVMRNVVMYYAATTYDSLAHYFYFGTIAAYANSSTAISQVGVISGYSYCGNYGESGSEKRVFWGGLFGYFGGTTSVSRCFYSGQMYTSSNIANAASTGLYCGGLVGDGASSSGISDCYFYGHMDIYGFRYVGGIAGRWQAGMLRECYYHDSSTAYMGGYNGGGIVGQETGGYVVGCFTDSAISYHANSNVSTRYIGAVIGSIGYGYAYSCSWYSTKTSTGCGYGSSYFSTSYNAAYTTSTLPTSSNGSSFYTSTSYLQKSTSLGTAYAGQWSIYTGTTSVSSSYTWAKYVGNSTTNLNSGLPVLYWSLKYVRVYRYTTTNELSTSYAYLKYAPIAYEYETASTTTATYKYCLLGQTVNLSLGTSSTVTGWKFARWNVSTTTTPTTTSLSTETSLTTFISGLNGVTTSTSNYYHYYYAVYEREKYAINININDPNGNEIAASGGTFTAKYSFNDTTYSNISDQPKDPDGTNILKAEINSTIQISNIVPVSGYRLDSVTMEGAGTLVDNGGGVYTFTVDSGTATININLDYDYAVVNFGGTNMLLTDGAFYSISSYAVSINHTPAVDQTTGQISETFTFTSVTSGATGGVYLKLNEKLTPGVEYVWTVDVKASKQISLRYIGHEQGGRLENQTVGTNWQTFTHRFTATDSTNSSFIFYSANWAVNDVFEVKNASLQRGEDLNGDGAVASRAYTANGVYTNLPTPTKAGYAFKGWYTGKNGTGTKVNNGSKLASNTDHILYAYFLYDTDNQLKYDAEEDYYYFEDGEYPQSDADQVLSMENLVENSQNITYDKKTNLTTITISSLYGGVIIAEWKVGTDIDAFAEGQIYTIEIKAISGGDHNMMGNFLFGVYDETSKVYLQNVTNYWLEEKTVTIEISADAVAGTSFRFAANGGGFSYNGVCEITIKREISQELERNAESLDNLYDIKYLDANGTEQAMPVYEYDGQKYALATVGEVSKWFKVEPIRWRVDMESPTEFDGTNAVNLGREGMYEDEITVNLWAYMDNWADYEFNTKLISCTESGGFAINDGTPDRSVIFWIYQAGVGYTNITTNVVMTGLSSGWHMFTFTFDGSYARGYIDGVFVGISAKFESGKIGYHSTNAIFIGAEAGGNATTPAGEFFKGKMRNWSIVHEAYSADKIAKLFNATNADYAGFEKYGDSNTNFTVVSADVLGFGAITTTHAKEGWSYVQTDSVDLTNVNTRGSEMNSYLNEFSNEASNLQYIGSKNVLFEKFSEVEKAGSNTETITSTAGGIRVASLEEIETIADTKAKASDLVAFLSSGGYTSQGGDWAEYWTRNLGSQLDTAKMVSSVGTVSDSWLQNAMGVRFAMTMSEGINLIEGSGNYAILSATNGEWEVIGQQLSVDPNTRYNISVNVEAPSTAPLTGYNGLALQVLHAAPTNNNCQDIALETYEIVPNSNGRVDISFNSGSYSTVWVVINGGYIRDNTNPIFKFWNWQTNIPKFDSNMQNWKNFQFTTPRWTIGDLILNDGIRTQIKEVDISSIATGASNLTMNFSKNYLYGLQVGDVIEISATIQWENVVIGTDARIILQGAGNVTGWTSDELIRSQINPTTASGSQKVVAQTTLTAAMLSNLYYNAGVRVDYITGGTVKILNYTMKVVSAESARGILPDGYTQLEYIESTGTQWIDTGYYTNPNSKVVVDYQFLSTTPQQRIFGYTTGSSTISDDFVMDAYINGGGNWAFAYQNGAGNWWGMSAAADTNRHVFCLDGVKKSYAVDGGGGYSTPGSLSSLSATNTSKGTMFLFAENSPNGVMNTAGSSTPGVARLYYAFIYDADKIVRAYVPCIRGTDGAVGLYDLISGQFFGNAGTGSFVAGGGLPDGLTQLEYIESTGTQYIDTGYYATPNTRVVADYQFTDISENQQVVFGVKGSLVLMTYINGTNKLAYAYQNDAGNWINTNISADTSRHTYDLDGENKVYKVDSGSAYSGALSTYTATNKANRKLFLLAGQQDGSEVASNFAKGRLYACQIYDAGKLVRDFVPCMANSDGTVGLYDRVSGQFFGNAGTGNFIAGGGIA